VRDLEWAVDMVWVVATEWAVDTEWEVDMVWAETSIGGEVRGSVIGPGPDSVNTRGIGVEQCAVSGPGELSVWEFSGSQEYFILYDHFIGNANCIHCIVFSLAEPAAVQVEQVTFWLSFLQSRIPPVEPLGDTGRSHKPAYVVLVGTHLDVAGSKAGLEQAAALTALVYPRFGHVFEMEPAVLCLDSHAANSQEVKKFKSLLQERKQRVIEGLPRATQFLEAVVAGLGDWVAALQPCPVVTWQQFTCYLHLAVNPLAGEEHLKEVVQQLQLMGEVVYLKWEGGDMVVLDPAWLCSHLAATLLSPAFRQLAPATGVFSLEQLQLAAPEWEAREIVPVLAALGISSLGESGPEFPCYWRGGLESPGWDRVEKGCAGGVALRCCPAPSLLSTMFPRVQVQLRRAGLGAGLQQWEGGSALQCGQLQAGVRLRGHQLEVRVGGPAGTPRQCFAFLEEILGVIDTVLLECSPGLPMDKLILSSADLAAGLEPPAQWSPRQVMLALHTGGWRAELAGGGAGPESLSTLLCFGSAEVEAGLLPGPALPVSSLSTVTRQAVCQLLDPPHPLGRDWCMLAVQVGLADKVPKLDVGAGSYSQTARLLDEWSTQPHSSIGELVTALQSLGREDVVDTVLSGCSLYRIVEQSR